MVTTIRKPENPATKRQLWYLHILTGRDTRNMNLTVKEVSEAIDKARTKTKPVVTAKADVPASEPTTIIAQSQADWKPNDNDYSKWETVEIEKRLQSMPASIDAMFPDLTKRDIEIMQAELSRRTLPAVICLPPPAQPTAWVCPTMPLALPEKCKLTQLHEILGKHASAENFRFTYHELGVKAPGHACTAWQSMKIGNHTITLDATLPNLYELIKEVVRTQTDKPRQATYHLYANGYESPQAHPLIVSQKWMKAHVQDIIPEPTMDLLIDGKAIHLNGNYKQGMIKDFMSAYTTRARVGHKVVNLNVGIADKVTQ